jgi:hypothetical protein
MEYHHRKLKEVNDLYSRHEVTIKKLQAAVRREIPLLAQELRLTLSQVKALEAFACDECMDIFLGEGNSATKYL